MNHEQSIRDWRQELLEGRIRPAQLRTHNSTGYAYLNLVHPPDIARRLWIPAVVGIGLGDEAEDQPAEQPLPVNGHAEQPAKPAPSFLDVLPVGNHGKVLVPQITRR